jgi:tRNA (mo5U34)-methyltransferase
VFYGHDTNQLHFEPVHPTLAQLGYDARVEAVPPGTEPDPFELGVAQLRGHGDYTRWLNVIREQPALTARHVDLNAPAIVVGTQSECSDLERAQLRTCLEALHPWRKGPFEIFGIELDAEWRSNLKWNRLESALGNSLEGQRVLDIGSGNGYYCLRALGAGAESALGVDPSALFVLQFEALRRLLPPVAAAVLPLAFERLPLPARGFDTVLSMGVLYHRRSPRAHLSRVFEFVAPGGRAAVESLVIDAASGPRLEPEGRYAGMSNVWCIPSVDLMLEWMRAAGFDELSVADVSATHATEQRSTPWMRFRSLSDALSAADPTTTIEGYPAPRRALVIGRRTRTSR